MRIVGNADALAIETIAFADNLANDKVIDAKLPLTPGRSIDPYTTTLQTKLCLIIPKDMALAN